MLPLERVPTIRSFPSKHILNAQVAIRAPCCKQWYDCAECHAETQDHRLRKTMEMAFMCKKCKKAFRKDMSNYEESDEYCPHCDNHYVSYLAGLVMIWLSTISDPTRDAGSAAVLLALLSRPPDTNLPIHRLSTQRHRKQPLASRVMMPVLIPGTSAPRRCLASLFSHDNHALGC